MDGNKNLIKEHVNSQKSSFLFGISKTFCKLANKLPSYSPIPDWQIVTQKKNSWVLKTSSVKGHHWLLARLSKKETCLV